MADVDDPYLYAAFPLGEWKKTAMGQWCNEHATDMEYVCQPDYMTYGYSVVVTGKMTEENYIMFVLKWGERIYVK